MVGLESHLEQDPVYCKLKEINGLLMVYIPPTPELWVSSAKSPEMQAKVRDLMSRMQEESMTKDEYAHIRDTEKERLIRDWYDEIMKQDTPVIKLETKKEEAYKPVQEQKKVG
ncbi:hypothetical protein KY339_02215 [Candidatus Woesearchaeota archaeon]|nr:hypothetical protein [Candidatus Woesearchaeota archaeon]